MNAEIVLTQAQGSFGATSLAGLTPVGQAITLGLATFVQEDLPTITAALLAAAGQLSWATAFWGCFLGIWMGDALLYFAARGLGRPLLQFRILQRLAASGSVAQSERWFAERGTWLLAGSRFVPGTRLPTYLAAGFLKVPLMRFLGVTGAAVLVWTALLFLLAWGFGPQLSHFITHHRAGLALCLFGAFAVLAGVRSLLRHRRDGFRRISAAYQRWSRWEFWPASLFYFPVVANYLRLGLRHRSFTLPTIANPGIYAAGLVGESKFSILQSLHATSPEFTAEAWLLAPGSIPDRTAALDALRRTHGVHLPFILKPDLGQRGQGVKLVRTESDILRCMETTPVPIVVQRYAPGPHEAGIFYYRIPGVAHGRIFSITEKVFPFVTGDGVRSVEALIRADDRARCIADRYLQRLGDRARSIPKAGEMIRLVEAGNHAQGCIFQDGATLKTAALEEAIDRISQRIPGFFIGRYDVRYTDADALCSGLPGSFTILELNGAGAEATHIYDARTSLWTAYRTLFQQWSLVFEIAAAHRQQGLKPMAPLEILRTWRSAAAQFATYAQAD